MKSLLLLSISSLFMVTGCAEMAAANRQAAAERAEQRCEPVSSCFARLTPDQQIRMRQVIAQQDDADARRQQNAINNFVRQQQDQLDSLNRGASQNAPIQTNCTRTGNRTNCTTY
jgi:TolA-binding protein